MAHGNPTARPPTQDSAAAHPVLQRFARLAPLDDAAVAALTASLDQTTPVQVRRDIMLEGDRIRVPLLLAKGWAARVRHLRDGRRQLLSLLLPGDAIGMGPEPEAFAPCTVTALTPVETCPAPPAVGGLAVAYAVSRALEEAYLLDHVMRLGRLNALERIGSLLLELNERLSLLGLANDGSFALPLTQELLGDALGLTSVHVNRMLQEARRAGDFQIKAGLVRLSDPATLAAQIGRVGPHVRLAG